MYQNAASGMHPRLQNDGYKPTYNPFRRLRRRIKTNNLNGDIREQGQDSRPSPLPGTSAGEDTPKIYGELFTSSETYKTITARDPSPSVQPVSNSGNFYNDEEKTFAPLTIPDVKHNNALWQFLHNQWNLLRFRQPSTQIGEASWRKDDAFVQGGETSKFGRKRRVIVVEYGKTDNVEEGS